MTCAVVTCTRESHCKGYCEPHYRRVLTDGDPHADVPIGDLQKKVRPTRECEVCGSSFVQRKHQNGRYCSRRCASSIPESVSRLVQAGRLTAKQRGDMQRGRGEGRSYRKLGGRHEHRVVAEAKIGRPLAPGEIVHHIDGNRLNNDPDNLAVMTQGAHIREHAPWRTGSQHAGAKLTETQVRELRMRRTSGETAASLARHFGISRQHVSWVALHGWSHV